MGTYILPEEKNPTVPYLCFFFLYSFLKFLTMKYIAAALLFCLVALISDVKGDIDIVESNPCNSYPCQNFGTCYPFRNGFRCGCLDSYGEICQYGWNDLQTDGVGLLLWPLANN